ncbi:hypothetical protein OC861_006937 [Tilletia horrida]|nr:hypothetical protein OC861_006937 [Tilletia horrida]
MVQAYDEVLQKHRKADAVALSQGVLAVSATALANGGSRSNIYRGFHLAPPKIVKQLCKRPYGEIEAQLSAAREVTGTTFAQLRRLMMILSVSRDGSTFDPITTVRPELKGLGLVVILHGGKRCSAAEYTEYQVALDSRSTSGAALS